MKNELNKEQSLSNKSSDDMELNLTKRIQDLRTQLAGMAMQLSAKGELNFATHIHTSIAQLNVALEEIRWPNVLEFLTEIEHILLACKIGVGLPNDEATLKSVHLVRTEVRDLVQLKQYVRK